MAVRLGLEAVVALVRDIFEIKSEVLIRANLICETTKKTLRVTYTYAMDTSADTDDQLEFVVGSGACSRCWKSKEVVVCDLEAASTEFDSTWAMSKYQQAWVRKDLKALLCYPILDESVQREGGEASMLAVLNLDSPDKALYDVFRSDEMQAAMEAAASMIRPLILQAPLKGALNA